MPYGRRSRRFTRKRVSRRKTSKYSRKNVAVAYRALRIARSANRRVAGEVCKFESTPNMFSNNTWSQYQTATNVWNRNLNTPLTTITSGTPWIMPLNWVYTGLPATTQSTTGFYVNGIRYGDYTSVNTSFITPGVSASLKNPIWYNTLSALTDTSITDGPQVGQSTELQYRLKYIYINALFNAASGNPDGAVRIVIVKDKQPTGGSATWFDKTLNENSTTYNYTVNSRGVFNSQRIDAQLNPNTVGRFKIMYDKTLRFTTINSYKPFKYYKKLSSIVRNNRDYISNTNDFYLQTSDQSPPVQKNAYYLMIFSDGLNFTYTSDPTTADGSFHLFNRVAFYNN